MFSNKTAPHFQQLDYSTVPYTALKAGNLPAFSAVQGDCERVPQLVGPCFSAPTLVDNPISDFGHQLGHINSEAVGSQVEPSEKMTSEELG